MNFTNATDLQKVTLLIMNILSWFGQRHVYDANC